MAGLLLGASASASAQLLPPQSFHSTVENGQIAAGARGYWNLPSYGWLLDFGPHKANIYEHAGTLCWQDPVYSNSESVDDQMPAYTGGPWPLPAAFATDPDGTQYRTEALPALPLECTRALDRNSPSYIFEAVTSALFEFYPFEREHHVNWAARAAQLRPRAEAAQTDQELQAILADLLRGVDDGHTFLSGTLDGKSFEFRTFRGRTFQRLHDEFAKQSQYTVFTDWLVSWVGGELDVAYALLDPATRQRAFDGGVQWGRLGNNIGYLSINEMGGFGANTDSAADRALLKPVLDRALRDLGGTRALVLDVSQNLGGDDMVGSDIAARFADRAREAYSMHAYRDGQTQVFLVSPSGTSRYLKPVYLLTSELTSSAAETFTMRMRALPNVTQVGEPTQGIFSDEDIKGLPNGWVFSLSAEIYKDPQGRNYEGIGLPPDRAYPVFPGIDFADGYRKAILRAAELAGRR